MGKKVYFVRTHKTLASVVRNRMDELNLTVEDVAASIPVTASTLQEILQGEIERPPDDVLQALATRLDLSVENLMREANENTPDDDPRDSADSRDRD